MSTAILKAEVQARIDTLTYPVDATVLLQSAVDTVGLDLDLTNIISVLNSSTAAIDTNTPNDDVTALNAASIALGVTSKGGSGLLIGDYVATENTTTESGNALIPADGRKVDAGTYPELAGIVQEKTKGESIGYIRQNSQRSVCTSPDGKKAWFGRALDYGEVYETDLALGIRTLVYNITTIPSGNTYVGIDCCISDDGQNIYILYSSTITDDYAVVKSNDGGDSWDAQVIFQGRYSHLNASSISEASTIGVIECNPAGTEVVILGLASPNTEPFLAAKSIDSGASFSDIGMVIPSISIAGTYIYSAFISRDLSTLLVSTGNGQGTFLSKNGGDFVDVTSTLPFVGGGYTKLFTNETGDKFTIISDSYASKTSHTILYSDDQMATWAEIPVDLELTNVANTLSLGLALFNPLNNDEIIIVAGADGESKPVNVYLHTISTSSTIKVESNFQGVTASSLATLLSQYQYDLHAYNGEAILTISDGVDKDFIITSKIVNAKFLEDYSQTDPARKIVADII